MSRTSTSCLCHRDPSRSAKRRQATDPRVLTEATLRELAFVLQATRRVRAAMAMEEHASARMRPLPVG
jgi:predicted component of type VI protein secretion system